MLPDFWPLSPTFRPFHLNHLLLPARHQREPALCVRRPHQLPVMLEDHLRTVPRLQRHLRRALHRRHGIGNELVPQGTVHSLEHWLEHDLHLGQQEKHSDAQADSDE